MTASVMKKRWAFHADVTQLVNDLDRYVIFKLHALIHLVKTMVPALTFLIKTAQQELNAIARKLLLVFLVHTVINVQVG